MAKKDETLAMLLKDIEGVEYVPAEEQPATDVGSALEDIEGVEVVKPHEPAGGGESFIRGAMQGASSNYADEATQAIEDIGVPATDARPARQRFEDAKKANPKTYAAGQVVGALAPLLVTRGKGTAQLKQGLLGLMGQGAKTGALYGALAGSGEGEGLVDTLVETGKGAMAGGVLGAGGALLGEGLRRGYGFAKDALARHGERADELRVLTTMGATGGSINQPGVLREAQRVPGGVPEMARVLRETGISRGLTTTGRIAERAEQAKEEAGQLIGKIIEATDDGGGRIAGPQVAARLRDVAAKIQNEAGGYNALDPRNASIVDELIAAAKRYDGIGEMTLRQAQTRISGSQATGAKGLQDLAQFSRRAVDLPTTAKGDAAAATIRALRSGMDEAVDSALKGKLPDEVAASKLFQKAQHLSPADAYRQARRTYQVADIASDAAETSLARSGKNNLISLTDATLIDKVPVLGTIYKVLKPLQSSARATWAETAQSLAKQLENPEVVAALGRAGPPLAAASARGGEALKTVFDHMMQADPQFRAFMQQQGADDEKKRADPLGPLRR